MGKKKHDYVWRVTQPGKGRTIEVSFGTELSEVPVDDETKLRVVGEALIKLGTRLLNSSIDEDDGIDDLDDGEGD